MACVSQEAFSVEVVQSDDDFAPVGGSKGGRAVGGGSGGGGVGGKGGGSGGGTGRKSQKGGRALPPTEYDVPSRSCATQPEVSANIKGSLGK